MWRMFLNAPFQHFKSPEQKLPVRPALNQVVVRVGGNHTRHPALQLKSPDAAEVKAHGFVSGAGEVLVQNIRIVQQQGSRLAVIDAVVDFVGPVPAVYQGDFCGFPVAVNRAHGAAVIQLRIRDVNHSRLVLIG